MHGKGVEILESSSKAEDNEDADDEKEVMVKKAVMTATTVMMELKLVLSAMTLPRS
jgi:hypothetical protein